MKRIFCFVFLMIFSFTFSACSNKNSESVSALNLDYAVAEELENLENVESFDDETLKALAIVVRTKKKNENQTTTSVPKNERIYNIVKETSDIILKDGETPAAVNFEFDDTWEIHVKKYKILKYLSQKGISLANVSDIEKNTDENGRLVSISIGGKIITFEELKEVFNLPTNIVTDFKITQTELVLFGEYEKNDFDLTLAEEMSKQGKKHNEILGYFFQDFKLSENLTK